MAITIRKKEKHQNDQGMFYPPVRFAQNWKQKEKGVVAKIEKPAAVTRRDDVPGR